MTESTLRAILRDWMTEIGITITERNDAEKEVGTYVLKATTTNPLDPYDNAMTYTEKRLGLTLPTTVDAHDLLFELGTKLWLCNRILAREVGNMDIDNKKLSQIFGNVREQYKVLKSEFEEIRSEIWGKGKTNSRTTTGDLEITHMSIISKHQDEIDDGTILELD